MALCLEFQALQVFRFTQHAFVKGTDGGKGGACRVDSFEGVSLQCVCSASAALCVQQDGSCLSECLDKNGDFCGDGGRLCFATE